MEEGIVVPQIDTNTSNKTNTPAPGVAALTGDNATDLAAIAREMGVTLDASGNVAKDATRAQQPQVTPTPVPAPAAPVNPAPVEVPPKFQNADGTPNAEKIEKSTKSVEEMLAYYKAKEREAQQVQNRVNNPVAAPQAVPVAPQAQGLQLSQFERQAAIDILNDAAALGIQMSEQQAILQARADIRMSEAKYAAERSLTEDLRREVAENRMTAELKDLMAADDGLLTPAVADRVLAIKQEMGLKTYREAYIQHLGQQAIAQRTGQVKTPIPTGSAVKAPPTPVGPVSRVIPTVNTANPHSMTNEQLEAEIRNLYPRYRGINR